MTNTSGPRIGSTARACSRNEEPRSVPVREPRTGIDLVQQPAEAIPRQVQSAAIVGLQSPVSSS